MLPDQVSNPGPLTYESGALPIALRGPAIDMRSIFNKELNYERMTYRFKYSLIISEISYHSNYGITNVISVTSLRHQYDIIAVMVTYSQLSLSRLRLSRITAYLEKKISSLFLHRNLKSGYKILWKRGEIAPGEQFLPFSTIFSMYISN